MLCVYKPIRGNPIAEPECARYSCNGITNSKPRNRNTPTQLADPIMTNPMRIGKHATSDVDFKIKI